VSDFLTALAARETGLASMVLPRLPSRFEPVERGAPPEPADSQPAPQDDVGLAAAPAVRPRARRAAAPIFASDPEIEVQPRPAASPRPAPATIAASAVETLPRRAGVRAQAAPPLAPPLRPPVAERASASLVPPPAAPSITPAQPTIARAPAQFKATPSAGVAPASVQGGAVPHEAGRPAATPPVRPAAATVEPAPIQRQAVPVAAVAAPRATLAPQAPAVAPAIVPAAVGLPAPGLSPQPTRRADTLVPAAHSVALQVRARLAREPEARAPAPTIHVTIGRVEVRAVSSPPAAPRSPAKTASLSLEQFLAQQKERGGR